MLSYKLPMYVNKVTKSIRKHMKVFERSKTCTRIEKDITAVVNVKQNAEDKTYQHGKVKRIRNPVASIMRITIHQKPIPHEYNGAT